MRAPKVRLIIEQLQLCSNPNKAVFEHILVYLGRYLMYT